MSEKQHWKPVAIILIVSIGILIIGILWGRHTDSQEPSRGGHFHADGTWHAQPHETPTEVLESVRDVGGNVSRIPDDIPDAIKNMPLETSDEVQQFLNTAPREVIRERVRYIYIRRHYQKYPNCQEHRDLFADALNYASWFLIDREHRKKHRELSNEWKAVGSELDKLYERITNMPEDQALQFLENMSDSEEQAFNALEERRQAAYERVKASRSYKPVRPEPTHTH